MTRVIFSGTIIFTVRPLVPEIWHKTWSCSLQTRFGYISGVPRWNWMNIVPLNMLSLVRRPGSYALLTSLVYVPNRLEPGQCLFLMVLATVHVYTWCCQCNGQRRFSITPYPLEALVLLQTLWWTSSENLQISNVNSALFWYSVHSLVQVQSWTTALSRAPSYRDQKASTSASRIQRPVPLESSFQWDALHIHCDHELLHSR